MNRHFYIENNFSDQAKKLRNTFEQCFADERGTSRNRFVWDYWHVPEQYTHLRTPAQSFFEPKEYQNFLIQLLSWGQENLGCRSISPPWLSCYVDGCEQKLHADIPHGPWAFVFSLTPWRGRKFTGGKTIISKQNLLSYWSTQKTAQFYEQDNFFDLVSPEFNRLLVFNPRLPHGVETVKGVQDPREGRLVIHGWFTEPRPFIQGGLSPARAAQGICVWEQEFKEQSKSAAMHGYLCLRLNIRSDGRISAIEQMCNTLMAPDGGEREVKEFLKQAYAALSQVQFAKTKAKSVLTLPLNIH